MEENTKGFSTLVMIVIIAILGIIAYGVFKKTTLAPEETPEIELVEETKEVTTRKVETYKSPETKETVTTTETNITITEEDFATLESETSLLQTEFDDLMFEDLGFE